MLFCFHVHCIMARIWSTLLGVALCTSWLSVGDQLTCSIISFCPSTIIELTCETDELPSAIKWTVTNSSSEPVCTVVTGCTNSSINKTSNDLSATVFCALSDNLSNVTFEADPRFEEYTIHCGNETGSSAASYVLNITGAVDCREDSMPSVPSQTFSTPSLQSLPVLLITWSLLAGIAVIVSLVVLVTILLLAFRYAYKKRTRFNKELKLDERNENTYKKDVQQVPHGKSSWNVPKKSSKRLRSFSAPQLFLTTKELRHPLTSHKSDVTPVIYASPQDSCLFPEQQMGQIALEYLVPKDVVALPEDDKSKNDAQEPIYAEPMKLTNTATGASESVFQEHRRRTFGGEKLADMPGYSTPPAVHKRNSGVRRDSGKKFSSQGEVSLPPLPQEVHDSHTYDTIL